MKQATKLSRVERLELSILLGKGHSLRSIARAMGRSPNTISAEVKRNMVCGVYDPHKAQHKAYVRKKYSRFQWKRINHDRELRTFITDKLKKHWSPDAIAGYMEREQFPYRVSKNTIYRWLYSTQGVPWCRYLSSQRYRRKPRKTQTKRTMIPNRVSLSRRPTGADTRSRYGHWEVDTVVSGKRGRGALCVMVERKSRYIDSRLLGSMRPSD
jgi:IS30 family transposase